MITAEIIRNGYCTAACLCGMDESLETCSCRCGGEYHGALAFTHVEGDNNRRPWWKEISQPGSWIGEMALDVRIGRHSAEHSWIEVEPTTGQYDAHAEVSWEIDNTQQERLTWILAAHQIRFNTVGISTPSKAIVYGIRGRDHAKVVAAVLDFAMHGKKLIHVFDALTGYAPHSEPNGLRVVSARDMTEAWLAEEERKDAARWAESAKSLGMNLVPAAG